MSEPRPAPLVQTTRQVAEMLWLAAAAERIGAPEIVTRLAPYVEAAIRAAGPAYDDADGFRDCEANSIAAALVALRGRVAAGAGDPQKAHNFLRPGNLCPDHSEPLMLLCAECVKEYYGEFPVDCYRPVETVPALRGSPTPAMIAAAHRVLRTFESAHREFSGADRSMCEWCDGRGAAGNTATIQHEPECVIGALRAALPAPEGPGGRPEEGTL